jgi:hypothetical protein
MASCGRTKRIHWNEGRSLLQALQLSEEILASLDQIVNRTKTREIFVADYRYSDLIVDRGRFLGPCGAPNCTSCSDLIQGTCCIPLAFVAAQSLEVFIQYSDRTAPLRIMQPGEVFGVFEVLDLILGETGVEPIWSLSAGARSVHIIAPVGNRGLPQWLRTRIGRQITWTKRDPHWQLVKESTDSTWNTKILVLPKEAIEKIRKTDRLFRFLLETGWMQSRALRNSMIDDAHLRGVIGTEISKEPAPLGELYHYATLRHLLNLIKGTAPSFVSASTLPQSSGPFDEFCRVLGDVLEENTDFVYEPVIMQPFHVETGKRAYYSLRCPSMPGPNPENVNTYAAVASAFRNVLDRLKPDPWPTLATNARFFVRDCDFRNYPGVHKAESLKKDNFSPAKSSRPDIYFDAPFFVAGIEFSVLGSEVHNMKMKRLERTA